MPNNQNVRSEQIQDLLSAVPNWMIRWGNSLIFLLILGLFGISWFVRYPDVITSEAMITTQIPPQKEYANSSGKLQALLVADGDAVSRSTPLAVIENSANFEDVFFLKSIVDTVTLEKKDFYFPLDELPVLFLGDVESDFALFENSYLQYRLNLQLQPHNNTSRANKVALVELRSRLRTLQSQRSLYKSELDFQKNNLDRHQQLFEKGVISQQEFESHRMTYLQAERSYFNLDASVSQLREGISNANRNNLDSQINRTKEEISLLKNVIQSFHQLKKAISEWERRYVMRSDLQGTVSFLNIWTENQQVQQGEIIFTIIPSESTSFVAKLKTPSLNSGKIKAGQKVRIKLENYPETEFGSLEGSISSVSLAPTAEGYYMVNVQLPGELITSYDRQIVFKQEMRGIGEIITEDLRLMDRFFYQLRSVVQ